MKRGQVYWVEIRDSEGKEAIGIVRALIMQNNVGNNFSTTTIIAIIRKYDHTKCLNPTQKMINIEGYNYVINAGEIRTIDLERLKNKITELQKEEMEGLNDIFLKSVGLMSF